MRTFESRWCLGIGKKGLVRLKPEMGFAPIQGFPLGRRVAKGDFEIGKFFFFFFFLTLDRMKELQCGGRDDKESEICDAIGSPYKLTTTHPEISVTWLCFRCIFFSV